MRFLRDFKKHIKKYRSEVKRNIDVYNKRYSIFQNIYSFVVWHNSLNSSVSTFELQQPWIALNSISFLRRILRRDSRVFEYGSGGSTLFFAKRVREVFSVEHDRKWFENVQRKLVSENIKNVNLKFSEPSLCDMDAVDPSDPNGYMSGAKELKDYSFEVYVKNIEVFPNEYFDIIFIDGRARTSCIKHSVPKLKKGGFLIIDDADREYYFKNTKVLLNDFLVFDFPGPIYGLVNFYRTMFLKKM